MNSDTEQSFDEVGVGGGPVTRSRTRKAQTTKSADNKSFHSSDTSVHQPQTSSSQQHLEQNLESIDRSVNR